MTASMRYVEDPINVKVVVRAYLAEDKPTVTELAKRLGTHHVNVIHILKTNLPEDQYRYEKALRYSRSKIGAKNPMLGVSGERHPRYKGEVSTGKGYVQKRVNGRYVLVHVSTMLDLLGLSGFPVGIEVHHIDGNKTNNSADNLAVVTTAGHRHLHAGSHASEKLPLWERWQSGTSR